MYHRLILAAPDPEGDAIDDQLDSYHAAINDALNIVLANVKAASHELYLGRLNGSCAVYLPLPRFADCHTHIPTAEFQHVRNGGGACCVLHQDAAARRQCAGLVPLCCTA